MRNKKRLKRSARSRSRDGDLRITQRCCHCVERSIDDMMDMVTWIAQIIYEATFGPLRHALPPPRNEEPGRISVHQRRLDILSSCHSCNLFDEIPGMLQEAIAVHPAMMSWRMAKKQSVVAEFQPHKEYFKQLFTSWTCLAPPHEY